MLFLDARRGRASRDDHGRDVAGPGPTLAKPLIRYNTVLRYPLSGSTALLSSWADRPMDRAWMLSQAFEHVPVFSLGHLDALLDAPLDCARLFVWVWYGRSRKERWRNEKENVSPLARSRNRPRGSAPTYCVERCVVRYSDQCFRVENNFKRSRSFYCVLGKNR